MNTATTQQEIDGQNYSFMKMDVPAQAEFMRRLAPALSTMQDNPMAAFGALRSEDFHYVMAACLFRTQRQHMGQWTAVATKGGEFGYLLMFDDIDLTTMFNIVLAYVQFTLSRAFRHAGTNESTSPTTQPQA